MSVKQRSITLLMLGLTLLVGVMQASAQEDVLSASALRAQALSALQKGETEAAVLAADAMVRQHPEDSRAIRLAADIYLRSGKVRFAARLFDRYLEAEPTQMPELWQRGIALYFTGEFNKAAKQFEVHRNANPNDVENAAWHFLCVAKAESPQEAKRRLLPAPDDSRIPMTEVLAMLSSGDTDAVRDRVNAVPVDSDARESAAFYGDFYLGLYADAMGNNKQAQAMLAQAAENAPRNYMGDIARVYAKQLTQKKNAE